MLIHSYLSNRWQRTKINTSLSDWTELLLGVPQGSILGPLFFNIYTNDLFWFNEETEIANTADDNTFFACDVMLEEVIRRLEHDALIALEWFEINYMKMNAGKCHLLIGGDKSRSEHIFIKVGEKIIWESNDEKLLGVIIDDNLNFNKHITNLCKKANRKISALIRVARYLTIKQRRELMNSFITSHFSYSSLVWMFHTKELNNMINEVHERSLRVVYGSDSALLTFEDLLEKDHSCTIHHINIQSLALEMYKCYTNIAPLILSNLFPKTERGFFRPSVRTVFMGQQSLRYFSSQVWGIVPDDIKECGSFACFKAKIRKWIPSKCPCRLCKPYLHQLGFVNVV